MPIRNNIFIHFLVLLLGMVVCGTVAVNLGKELTWDLASYHYYNPYAFINQRSLLDNWPAEFVHVHLTPTADFLTYYLITFFRPRAAVFLLGALHGINLWLLYFIALDLVSALSRVSFPRLLAFLLAVLGMYGPTVIPGLGSFSHDALVSLFVLGFVALFLRAYRNNFSSRLLIGAGLLLGISAGLKLTAGIFILGALLSVLALNISFAQPLRVVLILLAGIVAGMFLTSGYWLMLQWQHYHNPVFPFMNAVFHSADFPANNWNDTRFLPKNWLQAVFYPFYFSFDGRTSDTPFIDFRFAVLYILLFAGMVMRVPLQSRVKWLMVFYVLAYIIWLSEFSIMRYAMPLEMLAPLLIFLIFDAFTSRARVRDGWIIAFSLLTYLTMYPTESTRAPWYTGNYFNVNVPSLALHASQALVLMPVSAYALALKPRPQTYLIAFLPQQWRYQGIAFQHEKFTLSQSIIANIDNFNGRIFLLSSSEYLPLMIAAAAKLHLAIDGRCADITSDRQQITAEDVKLCPVKKLSLPSHLV